MFKVSVAPTLARRSCSIHIDVGEYAAPRNRPVFRKKLNYATTEMLVGPCRVSLIAKSICEEGKSNSRRAAGKFFFPRV